MILLAFKIIDLKVPLTYIGSFSVFLIFYMIATGNTDVNYFFSEIFGGGLMLGAWFMATDYVTTPITPKGQLVYGCCLGILTAVLRLSLIHISTSSDRSVPVRTEKFFGYQP